MMKRGDEEERKWGKWDGEERRWKREVMGKTKDGKREYMEERRWGWEGIGNKGY